MTDASSPPGQATTQRNEESQAREGAQEVAGQAQEKAHEAAGQARSMVREQIDQRSTQAGERVSGAAESLRNVGEELRRQSKEDSAEYADKGAEQAERLGSYLTESDGDKLLSDIEDLGRRQPLAVLAGGLVVGIAAARFLKASSRDRYRDRTRIEAPTRELGTRHPATEASSEPTGTPAAGRAAAAPPEAPVPAGPATRK